MSKEHRGFVKTLEATVRESKAAAKKKRVKILFTRMSVTPTDEEPGETKHVEKFLSNGHFYTGQWADNVPHGQGKYLWTDGCMYIGEWFKGKTIGKGKFSWPSGATYEGELKSGYMDGIGTYTGCSGDTYKGSWVMNLKHEKGTESFANGDYYEGEWRRGLQDGQGRYQWKNGNHYIGQWKKGKIHGNGTMMWSNGDSYDGFWEENLPKGNGTFRWANGSFYTGIWSQDPKEQSGSYNSSESSEENVDWDPQEVFKLVSNDCVLCPDEKISIFPSQKVLCCSINEEESSHKYRKRGQSTKPERMSVDEIARNCSNDSFNSNASESFHRYSRDGIEGLSLEGSYRGFRNSPSPLRLPLVKKQGITISKGHKNYELMLNLQSGIRHSVGRPAPATSADLKSSAFDPREKVWTKFPPEGSKSTPPHQSCEFKWKDYCPLVFRTLRKLFKVDPADYMLSICGNDALRELSSPGKSRSFFYLTNDDRYMIKTMKKAEVKVLLRMLPAYYNHVKSFENTLMTKFFGLHCVKLIGTAQKKVRFVIMGNLFCTEYAIHRRFDLKGSSHGRTTDKPETELDATTTLKDLDLNYIFRFQKFWFQEFCRQVDKDCDFLEKERIMDYSLLVGLHFRDTLCREIQTPRSHSYGVRTPPGTDTEANSCPSRADMDQLLIGPSRLSNYKLGKNIPALAEMTVRSGGCEAQLVGEPTGELYDIVMVFGIIDILQDYDINKKLEHAYKSIQYDPTSISAVDPKQYSKRFRDFIFRIFVEDS